MISIDLVKKCWPILIALILIGVFTFQEFRISSYKVKLSNCQIKLAESNSLLTQQNIAIKMLQAESDRQEKQLRDAENKSNQIRQGSQKDINAIMKAQIPEDCKAAVEWGVLHANADNL